MCRRCVFLLVPLLFFVFLVLLLLLPPSSGGGPAFRGPTERRQVMSVGVLLRSGLAAAACVGDSLPPGLAVVSAHCLVVVVATIHSA